MSDEKAMWDALDKWMHGAATSRSAFKAGWEAAMRHRDRPPFTPKPGACPTCNSNGDVMHGNICLTCNGTGERPAEGAAPKDCPDMPSCHAANGCLGYCKDTPTKGTER